MGCLNNDAITHLSKGRLYQIRRRDLAPGIFSEPRKVLLDDSGLAAGGRENREEAFRALIALSGHFLERAFLVLVELHVAAEQKAAVDEPLGVLAEEREDVVLQPAAEAAIFRREPEQLDAGALARAPARSRELGTCSRRRGRSTRRPRGEGRQTHQAQK